MKISLILFAATVYFFTACNSGSETSTTNSDTSTASTAATTNESAPGQDNAPAGNGLMKATDDMMAKMQKVEMTGDFDIDFANMMIEHHQGGIDMAQVEISEGKDEKMKSKAQQILANQKEEQGQLRDFVKNYKFSGMKHGEGELQKSLSEMSSKMKSMQMSGNIDRDFATMMSSHHQDGISMGRMELKHGMDSKLKQMAKKRVEHQQQDIKEFKAWLSANK